MSSYLSPTVTIQKADSFRGRGRKTSFCSSLSSNQTPKALTILLNLSRFLNYSYFVSYFTLTRKLLKVGVPMSKAFRYMVLLSVICSVATVAEAKRRPAAKQTCSKIITMHSVSPNSRGGTLIWKSNSDPRTGKELSFRQGNHSQAGAAFLVYYKSAYVPRTQTLPVLDLNGNVIARMGRRPRCLGGCGQHERWYLRGPGGSGNSVPSISSLARKGGGASSVLIPLRGTICAKISNVSSNREIAS